MAASSAAATLGPDSGIAAISETILQITERLLVEAAGKEDWSVNDYALFATSGVTMEDISSLLAHAVRLRSGTDLHSRLMRVLPFLTYACPEKMTIVVRHFDDVLDFDSAERKAIAAATAASSASAAAASPSPGLSGGPGGGAAAAAARSSSGGSGSSGGEIALEEALAKKSQAFVAMCEGIERNQVGNTMKAHMMDVVEKCVKYIAVS